MRDAEKILRARIAAARCIEYVRHRFLLPPALEQQQAQIVRGLQMALRRRLGVIDFGLAGILFDPAPQPVSLAHVELCIGIALGGRFTPLGHGSGVIALLPRGDTGVDIGQRHPRHGQQARRNDRFQTVRARISRGHSGSHPWPSASIQVRANAVWLTRNYHRGARGATGCAAHAPFRDAFGQTATLARWHDQTTV